MQDGKPIAVPWKAIVGWMISRNPWLYGMSTPLEFAQEPRRCVWYYPVKAEQLAGIGGVTDVSFTVSQGQVSGVSVSRSSGSAALDNLAVACVNSWQFVATVSNGQPIAVQEHVSIPWKNAANRRPSNFSMSASFSST